MSIKITPNISTCSIRIEYYAISKDGQLKRKITADEALEVSKSGKTKFWIDKRECISVELDCSVYEKQITRSTIWKQMK